MCVSPRFYGTQKTAGGNLLQEGMSKEDMNPVMYGRLKMVEYKVQIIKFLPKYHNFYTYLLHQLCEMPKFCLFGKL